MLLVSIVPISLYHRQVLRLSQEKLEFNESVQETELTRSMAEQIDLFESTLKQQLVSERQILALTGLIDNVNDPVNEPKVRRLLENFVMGNPNILYLTVVGTDAKGNEAGGFRAEQDPFVSNALQRAFTSTVQLLEFRSDPLALDPGDRPAFVMAIPLESNGHFTGMLAAVVSLDRILQRLQEASTHDRVVFVVDHSGAHRGPSGYQIQCSRHGHDIAFARSWRRFANCRGTSATRKRCVSRSARMAAKYP